MTMGCNDMYIGVDLGSTNIKAALYDRNMQLVDRKSRPVEYIRDNGYVEFDSAIASGISVIDISPHPQLSRTFTPKITGSTTSTTAVGRLVLSIPWILINFIIVSFTKALLNFCLKD